MTKIDTPMSHCPKGGSPITFSFSSPQNRDLLKDYGALSVKSPSVTCNTLLRPSAGQPSQTTLGKGFLTSIGLVVRLDFP